MKPFEKVGDFFFILFLLYTAKEPNSTNWINLLCYFKNNASIDKYYRIYKIASLTRICITKIAYL